MSRFVVLLFLALTAFGCGEQPSTRVESTPVPPPQPPTASDVLTSLEQERAAGRLDAALRHAQALTSTHDGTPEAEAAARLIPELEAAIDAAAEAERVRAAEAAAAAEAHRLAAKWSYTVTTDPMTSKETHTARITSENTVNFSFPYEGEQRATLSLRTHPTYGRDVILSIREGQFLCWSYESCTIRVRFDDAQPERWRAVGPADNSTTAIFLRNESKFAHRLRTAKVVRIQVPVYQQGEPIFEFEVGGYDHEQ